MKNYLLITALISILGGITISCGSSSTKSKDELDENQEVILRPQTTKISGPLGKGYSVVERGYKVQGDFPKLNVEIELTDPGSLPEGFYQLNIGTSDKKGDSNYSFIGDFIVEFLDSEGNVIETNENGTGIDRLYRLTQNDKGVVSFDLPYKMDNITHFRIISDFYPNEISIAGSNENNTEAVNDEEFNKAMEHATKAMETTSKMMENIINLTK